MRHRPKSAISRASVSPKRAVSNRAAEGAAIPLVVRKMVIAGIKKIAPVELSAIMLITNF
jgi:hypothetical protein